MEFRDPDSINQMFDYFLQLRPDDFFPASLLNKELCASVCYQRHEALGFRSRDFKGIAINDYKLDWLAGGVYTARLDSERTDGLVIVHRPTDTSVFIPGAALKVGEKLEILKNWLDVDAEIILPNGFHCKPASLFQKGQGPWKHHLDEKATQLNAMATTCNVKLVERREQQSMTSMVQGVSALELSRSLRKEEFKTTMAEKRKAAKSAAEATPSKRPKAVTLAIGGDSPAPIAAPPAAPPIADTLEGEGVTAS